jgi:hypothetical protein
MFQWMLHSNLLGPFVRWIPIMFGVRNIRLLHFLLMFVFISFGIFHVHICLFVSRTERRGLMDSIFTGYKVIPVDELEEDDHKAILASKGRGWIVDRYFGLRFRVTSYIPTTALGYSASATTAIR